MIETWQENLRYLCTSCRSLRLGTAVPKFWRMILSLLVGHSDLKTLVLGLTNETEYTCKSFRPGTVSPSYSLPSPSYRLTNETEYMCESFRPGTVSSSYSLTNETEYMRESFRPGNVRPSYSLTNETEYICESFRPGTVSPFYSLTHKTESYLWVKQTHWA